MRKILRTRGTLSPTSAAMEAMSGLPLAWQLAERDRGSIRLQQRELAVLCLRRSQRQHLMRAQQRPRQLLVGHRPHVLTHRRDPAANGRQRGLKSKLRPIASRYRRDETET